MSTAFQQDFELMDRWLAKEDVTDPTEVLYRQTLLRIVAESDDSGGHPELARWLRCVSLYERMKRDGSPQMEEYLSLVRRISETAIGKR
jgi:hypothetical protein